MIEAAEVKPGDRVLEIGAGSGYAAAVLSRIADRVYAIERHPSLAEAARRALAAARLRQHRAARRRRHAGLARGGAVRRHPGRRRRPASARGAEASSSRSAAVSSFRSATEERQQTLLKVTRSGRRPIRARRSSAPCAFVPLIGEQGWAEDGTARRHQPRPGRVRAAALPQMIAEAAEPLPDFDDPAFGRAVRPLRRPPRRPARRGEPRHRRVLSRAGGDHAPADRAARLHHRRGRGGLAGRGRRSTATSAIASAAPAPSRRSSAFRPGCGATPRSRPSSTGCAATTQALPSRSAAPASTASTSTT